MFQETFERTTVATDRPGCVGCISWTAIIIAALLAVGLSFLLNVFTSGIGLTAFTSDPNGQLTLLIGGFVWLILASYVIYFLVGWVAGMFVRPSRCLGVLHGFVAWCLALIITAALFSNPAAGAFGTPSYYGTKTNITAVDNKARAVTNSATNEEAANKLGIGVLAVFFIFLAGALGSITGAYLGSDQRFDKTPMGERKFTRDELNQR